MLLLLCLPALGQQPGGDTFRLYFMGGQSNMEGYGYNADLPDSLRGTVDDAWIFQGNPAGDEARGGGRGLWQRLQPGHGVGFTSDGAANTLSDRFGPELTFARRLQARYPGQKIAIIKYARGGSSIDSLAAAHFGAWEPDYRGTHGINQYDHFLATVRNALARRDINGDGRADRIVPAGIIWMQGESDASHTEAIAARYKQHLKRLMDLLRAALRTDDLPVVIGKISDSGNEADGKVWTYGELVQHAQEQYVRTDPQAAIVRSTRSYDYSDPWHYDSAGYIDLGVKFAEAVYRLNQSR